MTLLQVSNDHHPAVEESASPAFIRQGDFWSLYSDFFTVDWLVTGMCNYNCSYCFDSRDKRPNPAKFTPWESLKRGADNLLALNKYRYFIGFCGGEPTIHPRFPDLVGYLAEHLPSGSPLYVTTNGSRDMKYYRRLIDLAVEQDDRAALQFGLSIHTEYARLADIVEFLAEASPRVMVNCSLMFHLDKRDSVERIYETLYSLREELYFGLHIVPLLKPPTFTSFDDRYTEDDFVWLENANRRFAEIGRSRPRPEIYADYLPFAYFWDECKNGRREMTILTSEQKDAPYNYSSLLKAGRLGFKGMWCALGGRTLAINYNGDCFGGQCQATRHSAAVGNIYRSNPYADGLLPTLIQCPMDACGVAANHAIPKFSDRAEAEIFIQSFQNKLRVTP